LLSNSSVTRLGEQLKNGNDDANTLTELEAYRSEFVPAYNHVVRILKDKLLLSVTGRFKSTISIIEKLRRSSSRLAQIQDIAGCRVVATTTMEQREIADSLRQWFPDIKFIDRTTRPSNGYRAIHALVRHDGRVVEIQIRTLIQNFWASISEKVADLHGQEVKYGGGPPELQRHLIDLSEAFRVAEDRNEQYALTHVSVVQAKRSGVSKDTWKKLRDDKSSAKKRYESAMSHVSKLLASKLLKGI